MFNWVNKLINKAGNNMKEQPKEIDTFMDDQEKKWIEHKIRHWLSSPERRSQITGDLYYNDKQEILMRKRTAIGEGGELIEINNIPCNKIIDNQYAKMVDQKRNYLLGQPISIESDNKAAAEAVRKIIDDRFLRVLNALGLNCINNGIAWLFPYYNEIGEFKFKVFNAYEIIPIWKDALHTELEFVIRYYKVEKKFSISNEEIEKVEIYRKDIIQHFILRNNVLYPDDIPDESYMTISFGTESEVSGDQTIQAGWDKVPLIPFKFNSKEKPLINRCKSIQDAINETISEFRDNMQEDSRNTILILKNYDGENLSEFRKNLSAYGVVKVRSSDGIPGGVETLNVEVNAANYDTILKLLKKSLVENCRGYDVKDDSTGGNANQMHISAMFNDIDIDANEMEAEFQSSLDDLMFFVKAHLANSGAGDFENDIIKFVFNRDLMMNENEILDSLVRAGVQVPNRVLLTQVPFIDNVDEAEELLNKEKEESLEQFSDPFTPGNNQSQNQEE